MVAPAIGAFFTRLTRLQSMAGQQPTVATRTSHPYGKRTLCPWILTNTQEVWRSGVLCRLFTTLLAGLLIEASTSTHAPIPAIPGRRSTAPIEAFGCSVGVCRRKD